MSGDILNIVYQVGTFGNFLRWFTDKYSKRTDSLVGDPITDIGTYHWNDGINFSGRITRRKIVELIRGGENLPYCSIIPKTEKHFLYLSHAIWYRGYDEKDRADDLWSLKIKDMNERVAKSAREIIKLYDIKNDYIPRFIVRDWYKLGFNRPLEDDYNYKISKTILNDEYLKKQDCFFMDMESFFSWESFLPSIKELDGRFKINLDFDRSEEMKSDLNKAISRDWIRQEVNRVFMALEGDRSSSLENLSVKTEAYIYALYEREQKDLLMPLSNYFFKDIDEINEYIASFPIWYRQKNPNLG